ncbi:MAG: EscU/YscU/HrcU family type III secretion system export apparatus switch protein [Beijerinckiaceae bacterium]|nr:EscU/YscU/HrcU family type III secretion system export apparatus switch protein [Beijerinckiaceae bacterium]MCZ8301153.1 EscU/YscU/HrcU family type III secretion system export apparatus switch protein [Beijerinckiaceae bacterium]
MTAPVTLDPHLAEAARNPGEKIAVALKYDFGDGAPVVTAKGRGDVAEKILETAREHDVAIEQNPILAEALSRIELDTEIPIPLYKAVAEVIGFLLRTGQLNRPAPGEAPPSLTTRPDRR